MCVIQTRILIYSGYHEVVELLVKNNADLEAKDTDQNTALSRAAINGSFIILIRFYGNNVVGSYISSILFV